MLVLTASALPLPTQSKVEGVVAGVVFEDTDGDSQRGPGEPGVPGVVVCTRSGCRTTAEDGAYEVPVAPGTQIVWARQPDGFRSRSGFWRRVPADPFEWLVNIPFERSEETVSQFSFLHASDTHLDAESLPRFRRLRQIAAERDVAFVLLTGDLVRDALRVSEETARERYELLRAEIGTFPMPVWGVPGNHEIFGIERHLSGVSVDHPLYGKGMYRRFMGPTYYSFDYGGVHFMGLDTADIEDKWYYGHVDAQQLAWIESDLANVPAETPIVTFNHIPFFSALVSASGY
ncbi:MAG TPA: metallophosphoesterase, partial [Vicinamibacteria bacterium]|nr:metallophosphoesterase [Vicinamibacteria bacterium]